MAETPIHQATIPRQPRRPVLSRAHDQKRQFETLEFLHKVGCPNLFSCAQASRVSQQFSVIMIFIRIFTGLNDDSSSNATIASPDISAKIMIWSILLCIGHWIAYRCQASFRQRNSWLLDSRTAVSTGILGMVLVGISPILKNLTRDISSDTIIGVSVILFVVNMLCHDYGEYPHGSTRFPDSLSINAGVCAAVLLASRLDTNTNVFVIMANSILLFALYPIFRRSARAYNRNSDWFMTLFLAALTIVMWKNYYWIVTVTYVIAMLFITFFCPWMLVKAQKYKRY